MHNSALEEGLNWKVCSLEFVYFSGLPTYVLLCQKGSLLEPTGHICKRGKIGGKVWPRQYNTIDLALGLVEWTKDYT